MTDARAHALRARYHELFEAPELPVPVESIAEDLLGLNVEEADLEAVSGLLYPAERQIYVNASEPKTRQRFTLAHELGHWVCQHL
ncbi:MAG: ImmA/IrrE family metallo-endopeptidase, partial [Thermoleophilia bacterium]|nr:ImmA/IrrE family metallo-endopeptidase [Thermoleophilia bacterium]